MPSPAAPPPPASVDEQLARALEALSNPSRIALLRQLRVPKALRDLELKPPGEGEDARNISRQAVHQHLARLVAIGVVVERGAQGDRPQGVSYLLNNQKLFAIAEEFRGLARLKPSTEPGEATLRGVAPAAAYDLEGPCLVLVKGLDEGQTFDLTPPAAGRGEWVIGRRRGAAVPLDFDPFVSTENTLVTYEDGGYFVEGLPDSKNGTTLNFRPLPQGRRVALKTGNLIGAGRSLLMFQA